MTTNKLTIQQERFLTKLLDIGLKEILPESGNLHNRTVGTSDLLKKKTVVYWDHGISYYEQVIRKIIYNGEYSNDIYDVGGKSFLNSLTSYYKTWKEDTDFLNKIKNL